MRIDQHKRAIEATGLLLVIMEIGFFIGVLVDVALVMQTSERADQLIDIIFLTSHFVLTSFPVLQGWSKLVDVESNEACEPGLNRLDASFFALTFYGGISDGIGILRAYTSQAAPLTIALSVWATASSWLSFLWLAWVWYVLRKLCGGAVRPANARPRQMN
jgi:hypothetical protein